MNVASILKMNHDELYGYFITEAIAQSGIWILTDEYGCVMLNTEDEDCVPVWPSEALAKAWATDEWSACKAEKISLGKWQSHWTPGLEDDGFAVVICPVENQEGLIAYPESLDASIKKKLAKQKG